MENMVQNAVERMNELLAQLQRDRDAAELINLREKVKRLEAKDDNPKNLLC